MRGDKKGRGGEKRGQLKKRGGGRKGGVAAQKGFLENPKPKQNKEKNMGRSLTAPRSQGLSVPFPSHKSPSHTTASNARLHAYGISAACICLSTVVDHQATLTI